MLLRQEFSCAGAACVVLCRVVRELMSFFVMCFLASGGLLCVAWCCVMMLSCLRPVA